MGGREASHPTDSRATGYCAAIDRFGHAARRKLDGFPRFPEMEITIAQLRLLKQIRSSLYLMQKYVENANTKMSHGRATNVLPLSSGEGVFKSRRRLEAEDLFLRHQLNIALRRRPPRLRLRGSHRALLVWMTRLWPSLLGMARVVEAATILGWYRAGFRTYWRWTSRKRAGRPRIDRGLRDLIQRMSVPRSMSNSRFKRISFPGSSPARLSYPSPGASRSMPT
jgi:hypothetical protein